MTNDKKILIIEDDPDIVDLVEIHIKDIGFELVHAKDGQIGLQKALEQNYKLIILDIMLPKLDGIEVCKRIREENKYTPILMLTAKYEEFDKVLGLELGADDYLTKPFSIKELIARIKAILRRMDIVDQKSTKKSKVKNLQYDDLKIDLNKRKVTLGGETLELTAKEFELLALFALTL